MGSFYLALSSATLVAELMKRGLLKSFVNEKMKGT
jgi:hypothetical protein